MRFDVINQTRRNAVIIGFAAIFAPALGALVSITQFGYFQILLAILGIAGIFIVVLGSRGIRIGYLVFVLTLALGYRTLDFGNLYQIHPAEALIWTLGGLLVAERILTRQSIQFRLPLWIWLSIPFWLWGLWLGLQSERNIPNVLIELRVFLFLLPLFFVTEFVLAEPKYWRFVILAFVGATFYIAVMGLVEVLFPQVQGLFGGYVSNVHSLITNEGFARAPFSFWGTEDAIFASVLGIPFLIFLWYVYPHTATRVLFILIFIVELLALYFSGHRDAWFFFASQIVILSTLLRRASWAFVILAFLILFVFIAPRIIPESALQRTMTIVMAAQGEITDSSTEKRISRASNAVSAIIAHPQGSGWTSAGWVHSDFLQLAVNLGIAPGIVFFIGYCATLFYLVRQSWRAPPFSREHLFGTALVLAFLGVGGMLTVESTIVLIQLVLPVWLIWALVVSWLWLDPKIQNLI